MFLNCQECIEGLPLDPRVRSGRYHLSSCDYCSHKEEIPPTSFEPRYPRKVIVRVEGHPATKDEWKLLGQLTADVRYIKAVFKSQQDKRREDVRF